MDPVSPQLGSRDATAPAVIKASFANFVRKDFIMKITEVLLQDVFLAAVTATRQLVIENQVKKSLKICNTKINILLIFP